jgi:DDE superfamily endonuclease
VVTSGSARYYSGAFAWLVPCPAGLSRVGLVVGMTIKADVGGDLALLGVWERELDGLEGLVGARFWRKEPRAHAISYVKGLLSDVPTRNGWTIAEQSGHQTPDKIQKMLNRGSWDQDGVREDVRSYVVANLGDPGGVLVFDETGDIKQGTETVAVARQHTGVTGQVENCQVAVFAAYVSTHGQALVDTELYVVRREAPCCIPGTAGRNSEEVPGSDGLPELEGAEGTIACR